MTSGFSEPTPRWAPYSGQVEGRVYVYGGRTKDFIKKKSKVASKVHVFDACLEFWTEKKLDGSPPQGLYDGTCACVGQHLYLYGGSNGSRYQGSLYQLDTEELAWTWLADDSMNRSESRMVGCGGQLVLFGGYGLPSDPLQTGAQFVQSARSVEGKGWINELHTFQVEDCECKIVCSLAG